MGGIEIGWSTWGLGITMLGILGILVLRDHLSSRSPVLTGQGSIVGRSVKASHVSTGIYGKDRQLYQLIFRISEREELTLYVPENAYLTLKDGTHGQLTWQKDTLRSFVPEED